MDVFRKFYHFQRQSSQVTAVRKLDDIKYQYLNLYCKKQIIISFAIHKQMFFGTDIMTPGQGGPDYKNHEPKNLEILRVLNNERTKCT